MSAKPASAPAISAKRSGVYRAPASVEILRKSVAQAGLAWMELPLSSVSNKKQFLEACAKAMQLPSYFGGNWDALADCVRDFNWFKATGYVLHVTDAEKFAKASADDYATALSVFAEAAEFWKGRDAPFVVLVASAKDLPAF